MRDTNTDVSLSKATIGVKWTPSCRHPPSSRHWQQKRRELEEEPTLSSGLDGSDGGRVQSCSNFWQPTPRCYMTEPSAAGWRERRKSYSKT